MTASPELFLRRQGDHVASGPIKGTATHADELSAKDHAENVMIVDLVRNDLGAVAVTGSVEVPSLTAVEAHPGLVHLVSTVTAPLRPEAGWPDLLAATFPPGSVTGAPKSAALSAIGELEPAPRGPYCGAVGWVDADRRRATLAVGIRTFWATGAGETRHLHLGTGAGITWGSDPEAEWDETELKARRLRRVADRVTCERKDEERLMKVWLDGRSSTPTTHGSLVFDHGLTVGDGVFETRRWWTGAVRAQPTSATGWPARRRARACHAGRGRCGSGDRHPRGERGRARRRCGCGSPDRWNRPARL